MRTRGFAASSTVLQGFQLDSLSVSTDKLRTDELRTDEELALIKKLDEFPQIVADATEHLAPHFLALYAHELAGLFHDFYERHRVLDEANPALSQARLALCRAVQLVLERTFELLGLVAPERM
jgi:arginyl-tRNA synthetase